MSFLYGPKVLDLRRLGFAKVAALAGSLALAPILKISRWMSPPCSVSESCGSSADDGRIGADADALFGAVETASGSAV